MVQFGDIHLDLEYAPGSNKKCNRIMCCRKETGYPEDPKNGAGPLGALAACDIPEEVIYLMADKINELNPDVLVWTGDIAPHDQWNYTEEYIEFYNNYLFDFMRGYLSEFDLATYVLEGNHDFGEVMNTQDFSKTDPIFPFLHNHWKRWLTEEAQVTFAENGFYHQVLKTKTGKVIENVEVIMLNT